MHPYSWRMGASTTRERGIVTYLLLFVIVSVLAGLLVAGLALPVVGGVGLVARESANTFEPSNLRTPPLAQSSRMLAADGSLIATFYEQDRVDIPLSRVAPVMRQAIVAIEDSRFYEHGGFDSRGTLRALVQNIRSGQTQGGSTLTQQYVKNVLFEDAVARGDKEAIRDAIVSDGIPGINRKLRELQYAIAIEDRFTKDQILERYLNIAYFGQQAYGIEAAARRYFSKPAAALTLPEAALLAGFVRNPSDYDDVLSTRVTRAERATAVANAVNRRDTVLNRMQELGYITPAQATAAKATPLRFKPSQTANGCNNARQAHFFCDFVKRQFLANPAFGKTEEERTALLYRGGITIRTTLDRKVQRAAETAIAKHVSWRDPVQASIAVVKPGTGEVKAIAVSRGFGKGPGRTEVNYAVDYKYGRSLGFGPGSAMKPFVAAAALRQGYGFRYGLFSPYQLTNLNEVRTCDGRTRARDYRPRNETSSENGYYDMRRAMAASINTYWLQMERLTGLCEPWSIATRAGLVRANDGKPTDQVISWTLGTENASPLSMANAYAMFAARGIACEAHGIATVTMRNGKPAPLPPARCERVLDPEVADAVTYLLRGVVTSGTGRNANIGRPAAGKTGTNERKAVWYIGYTPDLAAGIGVWNPLNAHFRLRNVRIGPRYFPTVMGANLPAPIWRDTMEAALKGVPETRFVEPEGRFFSGTKGAGMVRERTNRQFTQRSGRDGRLSQAPRTSQAGRTSTARPTSTGRPRLRLPVPPRLRPPVPEPTSPPPRLIRTPPPR